jgi:hypothetical protein
MTESSNSDGTWLLWVIAIVLVAMVFGSIARNEYEDGYVRSCMESVPSPDPSSDDYDMQSLEFASEIRKCMRG